jgi:hypothetical protein
MGVERRKRSRMKTVIKGNILRRELTTQRR